MLDENLPAFHLKPSTSGIKHHSEFFLSHHGSEPEPAYHLEHADPASPSGAHKNCYALALFDAYNPEVLFGEVMARPEWTTSNASQGQGGGIPPAPQPIIPNEFTVQLYNPDQQVRVEVKSSKWGGSDSYEFSMPQDVFLTPSSSSLDKGASAPASLEVTPRINFVWRKDGRLNKDLTCFMTGKSTDKKKKSSKKDPDISIALWRQLHELTLYEPNLSRVELEDPKGLEVVLLLTAVVIKDLYFSSKDHLHGLFNVSDGPVSPRTLGAGGRKTSNPTNVQAAAALPPSTAAASIANKRHSLPKIQTGSDSAPPFPDARSQWALDAETARLKAQAEQEQLSVQRRKKEQEKKDEAERKRLQKMVEEEERAARKKQADIDKETERLRKLYGVKPIPQYQHQPSQPPPQPSGSNPYSAQQIHSRPYLAPTQQQWVPHNAPYAGPSASASNLTMYGANGPPPPVGSNGLPVNGQNAKIQKKSSFWR